MSHLVDMYMFCTYLYNNDFTFIFFKILLYQIENYFTHRSYVCMHIKFCSKTLSTQIVSTFCMTLPLFKQFEFVATESYRWILKFSFRFNINMNTSIIVDRIVMIKSSYEINLTHTPQRYEYIWSFENHELDFFNFEKLL